jgi:hypothetical protein
MFMYRVRLYPERKVEVPQIGIVAAVKYPNVVEAIGRAKPDSMSRAITPAYARP